MCAAPVEIAHRVGLEAIAVDDEGRRSFRFFRLRVLGVFLLIFIFVFIIAASRLVFFFGFRLLQFFGSGITQHENETLAVGRPFEIIHILNRIGQLLRLAADAVEQPHLRLAFVAFGEECEIFSVRTPARMRRGNVFRGHHDGIAAASRRHPDARLGFVRLQHGGRDRVGHPLAILRDLGIAHVTDFEDVVHRDGARRGWCGGSRLSGHERRQKIKSTGQCTKRQSK